MKEKNVMSHFPTSNLLTRLIVIFKCTLYRLVSLFQDQDGFGSLNTASCLCVQILGYIYFLDFRKSS